MKERTKGFVAGILVSVLILALAGTAFAAVGARTATLNYSDIKITLDGKALTPKDVNGNVVEPFIIDGTTYLPVRGISSALGLGVDWDQNTHTVKLSSTPVSGETTAQTPPANDNDRVKVIDAWDVYSDGYLEYCFITENLNSALAFRSPVVNITAYDAGGKVLATDTAHIGTIQPGEKRVELGMVDCKGEKPSRVSIQVVSGDSMSPSSSALRTSDFQFSGTSERTGTLGTVITGMVKNTSSFNANNLEIIVVFRKNGEIVGGSRTNLFGSSSNLVAGSSTPFELNVLGTAPSHDSYELWASPW